PAGAQILGRYTYQYFALMLGYGLFALICAGVAGWAAMRLDAARLESLRAELGQNPRWLWLLIVPLMLMTVIRVMMLAVLLVIPSEIASALNVLPGVLMAGGIALIVLLLDAPARARIDGWLADRWHNLTARAGFL